MLTIWITWSLLALLAWGLYGFLPKLAGQHLSPTGAMIYCAFGVAAAGAAGCRYEQGLSGLAHARRLLHAQRSR